MVAPFSDAPIRLLLADDHPVMRDGLKFMLEKHTDIAVVCEAAAFDPGPATAMPLRVR